MPSLLVVALVGFLPVLVCACLGGASQATLALRFKPDYLSGTRSSVPLHDVGGTVLHWRSTTVVPSIMVIVVDVAKSGCMLSGRCDSIAISCSNASTCLVSAVWLPFIAANGTVMASSAPSIPINATSVRIARGEIRFANIIPPNGLWRLWVGNLSSASAGLWDEVPIQSALFNVTSDSSLAAEGVFMNFSTTNSLKLVNNDTICAAARQPFPPITVVLYSSGMTGVSAASSPRYSVVAELLDWNTQSGRGVVEKGVSGGVADVRNGTATFSSLTVLYVTPPTVLRFRIQLDDGGQPEVAWKLSRPPLFLRMEVLQVAAPVCTLAVQGVGSDIGYLQAGAGLVAVAGAQLPPIRIGLVDTSLNLSTHISYSVVKVWASSGVELSSGTVVSAFNGVASFTNMVVSSLAPTNIQFELVFFFESNTTYPLRLRMPISLLSPLTRWEPQMIRFAPYCAVCFDPHFATPLATLLPPITVVVVDAFNNAVFDRQNNIEIRATVCTPGVVFTSASQTIKVMSVAQMDVTFDALWIDATRGAAKRVVTLTFRATSTVYADVQGRAIEIPVTVLLTAASAASRSIRVGFSPYASFVSSPLQRGLWATNHVPLPPIIVQILNADGSLDYNNSGTTIVARSLSGSAHGSTAHFLRGEAVFSALTVTESPAITRIVFTVQDDGNTQASGATLETENILVFEQSASVVGLQMRYDSYLWSDWMPVTKGAQPLPPVVVCLYDSSNSLDRSRDGDAVVASSSTYGVQLDDATGSVSSPLKDGCATMASIRFVASSLVDEVGAVSLRFCILSTPSPHLPCLDRKVRFVGSYPPRVVLSDSISSQYNYTAPLNASLPITFSPALFSGTAPTTSIDVGDKAVLSVRATSVQLLENASSLQEDGVVRVSIAASGTIAMPLISISNATSLLTDAVVVHTFTAALKNGLVACGSGPVIPLSRSPPTVDVAVPVVLHLQIPFALFRLGKWVRDLATFLTADQAQIVIRRVSMDRDETSGWAGTRVELHFQPASSSSTSPQSSPALLRTKLLASRSGCNNRVLGLAAVREYTMSGQSCERWQFQGLLDSALHCEAFLGIDARCSCFVPAMSLMGAQCLDEVVLEDVCLHLKQCQDSRITTVCNEVLPNAIWQGLSVVAFSALACIVAFLIVQFLGRGTRLVKWRPTLTHNRNHVVLTNAPPSELFFT